MAREKKEAALTPEERLQAALVPDWEWPYKLPGNWCWTRITVITDILNGFAFKSQHYSSAGIRIIRITNVQDGFIQDKKPVYYPLVSQKEITPFMLKDGDFLMSLTGNVGRVAIIDASFLPAALNQRVACLRIKSEDSVRKEYIFYFCLQKQFVSDCIKSAKGSAQLNMSTEWLKEYPIPLPPLAEQQRIVDHIESLFAKLDEAKEKAQAVVDSFETRKAAILHKAFTGELTAKWREERGVRMESWEQCSLSDVCTVNPKKADTKDLPDELEVSFFPMPALSEIYGEITDPQTRLLKEVRSGFTNFSEGDVVFAKITPCMENGKSAVVGKLVNDIGYGTTEFFVLRCSDRLYNRFLYHLVRDKLFRDKAKAVMAGAVGQQRVPKRYLETYKLNLPKFNEQREIVRILDGSFAKEQQTKEAAEAVLDRIDLMKKSILARAFRGELGTNDPSEESAVELLRQVIEQEDGDVVRPKAKAKRIAIPAEIKPLLSGANEEAIRRLGKTERV